MAKSKLHSFKADKKNLCKSFSFQRIKLEKKTASYLMGKFMGNNSNNPLFVSI